MPNFRYLPGQNVVLSDADVIVNTVNCVGVMGKGVAKAFLDHFGRDQLSYYFMACHHHSLHPGDCPLFPIENASGHRMWAAFASKDHWRNPSQIEWVARGLDNLARNAREAGARTIALPPAGCGLGGLKWTDVHPIAVAALAGFDRVDFHAPRP